MEDQKILNFKCIILLFLSVKSPSDIPFNVSVYPINFICFAQSYIESANSKGLVRFIEKFSSPFHSIDPNFVNYCKISFISF